MASFQNIATTVHDFEHILAGLTKPQLDPNPFKQFASWFQLAIDAQLAQPNAMTLATATRDGRPSARIVLLKDFDERGFVFFTNYASRKGRELTDNPQAALVFFWEALDRQVRVTGSVSRVSRAESEAYFHTRPVLSQLGAWASRQSEVLPNRETLEARLQAVTTQYAGLEIPLPPHWGGFRLAPDEIEFWQGRPNRLHDRFVYLKELEGWRIERLSP